jgi:hypothetical protein
MSKALFAFVAPNIGLPEKDIENLIGFYGQAVSIRF